MVDGVYSNSPLNTLRGACQSLGLSKGGGKVKLLQRLWEHLLAQELTASHSAERVLQGERMRPAIGQPVPTEPTEEQRAQHNLVHYMLHGVNFELQTMSGKMDMNLNHMSNQATVAFSFDFGYAARSDDDDKICALFLHDRHTGAMHTVPTTLERWTLAQPPLH